MTTMKTVRIHSYGGPEVSRYEDAPRPEPATSETLVRIHAAAVNPVDWMIRNGYGKDWWRHQMPLTLGCEYAGVVEAVGAGVSQVKPGDEVFGFINLVNNGAYAEFAVARETEVALKPKSLDFVKAATLPVAALTSWQALFDIGKLAAGQKVLIHAAAGGVGSIAVQLAKAKGATVLGTASARNLEFLRQLTPKGAAPLGIWPDIDSNQGVYPNVEPWVAFAEPLDDSKFDATVEAGKHTFVEKPVAAYKDQVRPLIEALVSRGS